MRNNERIALELAYDDAWRAAMVARIGRMTKAKEVVARQKEAVADALKAVLDAADAANA